MELPPFPDALARPDGWRGFTGPIPPPLLIRTAMWRGTVADAPAYLKPMPESEASRRIDTVTMLPTDDPLSSRHAEPAQEPVRSARRARTRSGAARR